MLCILMTQQRKKNNSNGQGLRHKMVNTNLMAQYMQMEALHMIPMQEDSKEEVRNEGIRSKKKSNKAMNFPYINDYYHMKLECSRNLLKLLQLSTLVLPFSCLWYESTYRYFSLCQRFLSELQK